MKIENLTPIEIAFLYQIHVESVQSCLTEQDVFYTAKCHWPMTSREIMETVGDVQKREFGKYKMPTIERVRELFNYYSLMFKENLEKLEKDLGFWKKDL
jgi:hypothetical protein